MAYQNNGVDWASISMSNFQLDTANASANVSASFRTFNNYLASGAGTDSATASASVTGVYLALVHI